MRVAEQVIDRRRCVVDDARTAIDEPGQIARHQGRGQSRRVSFVLAFLQELRVGERQIDDQIATQGADPLVRTVYDDLHEASSLPRCNQAFALQHRVDTAAQHHR